MVFEFPSIGFGLNFFMIKINVEFVDEIYDNTKVALIKNIYREIIVEHCNPNLLDFFDLKVDLGGRVEKRYWLPKPNNFYEITDEIISYIKKKSEANGIISFEICISKLPN